MDIFKLFGTIAINNSGAIESIDETAGKAETLSRKVSASFQSVGEKSITLGKKMLPVSAAFGGAAIASGKMALDFEDSMANINTLLDDDSHLRTYETAVKSISNETGLSLENMSAGMYQAISSLGDGGEETTRIFDTMARSAKAGGAEVSDSVALISSGMKGYNDVSAETAKKISDLAFQTAKLGVTTFPEMAASMQPLFPLANSLNLSYEELFGSMATLTGVTGNTAEVSTQLKAVFSNLMTPTTQMQQLIEKYGYSSGQAMLQSEGFAGMLKIVQKETGGQADKMAGLFSSVEAVTAMTALTGSQFDTFNDKLGQMGDAAGATDAAYNKMNTNGDTLRKTLNTLKNTAVEFGTTLITMLAPTINAMSKAVSGLSNWFNNLSDAQRKVVVTIAGVVAAVAPALIVFGKISSGIGKAIDAFGEKGLVGKIRLLITQNKGLAASSIAAEAGIQTESIAASHAKGNYLKLAAAKLSAAAQTARSTVANIANALSTSAVGTAAGGAATKVLAFASAHRVALAAGLGVVAMVAALAIGMAKSGLSAEQMAAKITEFSNNLATKITEFANNLPTMMDSIIPAITQVLNTIVGLIPTLLPALINAGISLFMGLVTSLTQVIQPLVAALPQIVNAFVGAIPVLIPAILNAGVTLFNALVDAVPKVIPQLVAMVPKIIASFISSITKSFPKILNTGVKMLTNLVNGVVRSIPKLAATVPKLIASLVSGIISNLPKIIASAVKIVVALAGGLIKAIPTLVRAISSLIKAITGGLAEGVSAVAKVGVNLIKGLWNGIASVKDWIISKVKGFGSGILDALKDFFGIHSPSKLMETKIGKQLAIGVANGISKNKKYAKKSAAELGKIIVEAAEKRLDRYKTYNDMSLAAEKVYWDKIRKQCKKGTSARLEADKKYIEAKKALNEQLKQAEDDYKAKIDEVNQKIEDRTKSILQAFNLFEEFATGDPTDSKSLINSLESQVSALYEWEYQMNALKDKIGESDLYKAIEEMGVSSLSQVKAINNMTEAELSKYVTLYNARQTAAKKQASNELETENAKELAKAYDAYKKTCDELGVKAKKAATDVSESFSRMGKSLLETVTTKMDSSVTRVEEAAKKMRNAMNFKWSLPKLRVPHIKIGGSFNLDPPSAPKFAVEWYRKGAVLTKPAAFGINPSTGKMMAGGEAGAEAVAPIDTLMEYVRAAVGESWGDATVLQDIKQLLESLIGLVSQGGDIVVPVYIGNEKIDEMIVNARQRMTNRSGGYANV